MIDPLKKLKVLVSRVIDNHTGNDSINGKHKQFKLLVGIFYFLQFTIAYQGFTTNSQLPSWLELLESERLFMPLWPVTWLENNYAFAARAVPFCFLVGSFLSVVFWNKSLWIRLISFLTFFTYAAFISSFGKIDHYLHLILVANFFLIWLSRDDGTEASKVDHLRIFWVIQLFTLLTYTISGFFKIYGILDQLLRGQTSALSSSAMGQNMAKTEFYTGHPTFFSEWVLDSPNYIFSIILISGYLIELVAVAFAFLPRFHRLIGILLILLHTGIAMTVGPDFYHQILFVGVLFLMSPFSVNNSNGIFNRRIR